MELDRELSDAFQTETKELIVELITVVEGIRNCNPDVFPKTAMEGFAQKIDRVMGTAKTFAGMDPDNQIFVKIGHMAQMCKLIGLKASERGDPKFLKPVVMIWTDVLKVIDSLVENLHSPDKASMATKQLASILKDRLKWLSEELGINL